MAWTTPKTWTVRELVTASMMNTHVRDNLNFLLSGRAKQTIKRDNGATYTTTSTSFVDIDGTNLKVDLTTAGGAVLVGFAGTITASAVAVASFDIDIDGTRYASAGLDGVFAQNVKAEYEAINLAVLVTGLSAGAHTFKIQWRITTGNLYLESGNGTSGQDRIPAFWAVEVG
jgi:hypothetical protein